MSVFKHEYINVRITNISQISNIPANETSLDLSWNELWRLTGTELAVAFAALPVTVTSLDLRGNGFGHLTGAEREELIEALSGTGKNIQLDGPLATELREARLARRQQYGRFFDEAKSALP